MFKRPAPQEKSHRHLLRWTAVLVALQALTTFVDALTGFVDSLAGIVESVAGWVDALAPVLAQALGG